MLNRSVITVRKIVSILLFAVTIFGDVSFTVDLGVIAIFKDHKTPLAISIAWPDDTTYETGDYITWVVMDNDRVITSDVEITDGTLPTEIPTDIIMKNRGRRTITIDVHLNDQHFSTSSEFQVYAKIVAIFPIIFVIVTAVSTQMVELSLAFGILVGAGIYCGSL